MKTAVCFLAVLACAAALPATDLAEKVKLSTTEDMNCGDHASRIFVSTGNRYFSNPGDKTENMVTTAVEELYTELRQNALKANPNANRVVGVRTEMAAGPAPGLNTLYIHVYGMAVEC